MLQRMDYKAIIREMETRAGVIHLSLRAICLNAGVNYANVCRWRDTDMSPKLSTLDRDLGALERVLSARELEVWRSLAPRFGGPETVSASAA